MNQSTKLQRSVPENEGMSSKAIHKFLDAIEAHHLELHSLIMLRHGKVITEGWWYPYQSNEEHMLFSLTKSFTSIGVGFAIDEGLLSLNDTVESFFPEVHTIHHNNFRKMTVRDLLTLSPGHETPTMGWELHQLEGSWVEHFLTKPIEHEPGTRFVYNTSATHMLSSILTQVTGEKLVDFLASRLFKPLGIEKPYWQASPEGHNTGGHGMSMKTEDIARFGQFLLQEGVWEGHQLLSKEWIKEATSIQIENGKNRDDDWQQGYGYQFWLCRYGAYRADGAFGQFCFVLPKQNAVIAITSAAHDTAKLMNLIWEHLLPAMDDTPLPINVVASEILEQKLNNLVIAQEKLRETSSLAEKVSDKTYKIDENMYNIKEISFHITSDACTFTLVDDLGEHSVTCGYQDWKEGRTSIFHNGFHSQYQEPILKVYAKAGWRKEHELEMTWCFVNTPFTDKIVCCFDGMQIHLKRSVNTDQGMWRPIINGTRINE